MISRRGNEVPRGDPELPPSRPDGKRTQQQQLVEAQAGLLHRLLIVQTGQGAATAGTVAFRLGQALLQAFASLDGLRRLPARLLALRRESRARSRVPSSMRAPRIGNRQRSGLIDACRRGGVGAVSRLLAEQGANPAVSRASFEALYPWLTRHDIVAAAEAARLACDGLPQDVVARWLALRLLECGVLGEGVALARGLAEKGQIDVAQLMRAEQAEGLLRLDRAMPDLSGPSQPAYDPDPVSLLYVVASSLPFQQTGYTLRTHGIVSALAGRGKKVTVLTRPGYPWDRFDVANPPQVEESLVDGVTYRHARTPRVNLPLDIYAQLGADAVAREARLCSAGAIHAASNHVSALPALIAARRLGIPFHYEMRGLWELSRASKVPSFDRTEAFALAMRLEGFVASQADRLFVISPQLANFAAEQWALDPARIELLPNGVDEAVFAGEPAPGGPDFTIGYAGALVPYEGIDLLIEAVKLLADRGCRMNLVIMGEGESLSGLQRQASACGLGDRIVFTGRLPQEEVRRRLRSVSLVCLPRRADRVCEIVPPLKLHEAMALGLPVLAPDLPVFQSEIEDEVTGLLFRAADVSDLADHLDRAASQPDLLATIGSTARARVRETRTWHAIIGSCGL